MKDEIKEILDRLNHAIEMKKSPLGFDYTIAVKDIELLLDYITNLQEENEYLNDELDNMTDYARDLENYKSRIDKVIEYIEKGNKHFKENYNEPYEYAFMVNADEIMKILQGKSDE